MHIIRCDDSRLPWAVVSEDGAVLGRFLSKELAELAAAAFMRAPLSLIEALLVA